MKIKHEQRQELYGSTAQHIFRILIAIDEELYGGDAVTFLPFKHLSPVLEGSREAGENERGYTTTTVCVTVFTTLAQVVECLRQQTVA